MFCETFYRDVPLDESESLSIHIGGVQGVLFLEGAEKAKRKDVYRIK